MTKIKFPATIIASDARLSKTGRPYMHATLSTGHHLAVALPIMKIITEYYELRDIPNNLKAAVEFLQSMCVPLWWSFEFVSEHDAIYSNIRPARPL